MTEITATSLPREAASEAGREASPPGLDPSPPSTGIIPSTLSIIERVALDPRADVEKLERMLALQERIMAQEAARAFLEAKARIGRKLADVRIVKTKSVLYSIDKNDERKGKAEAFRYAPMEEIDKFIRPLLVDEGMEISYTTKVREGGGAEVVARLSHPNGHFMESSIPLPLDTTGGKSNVQAMGSTVKYGCRYTTCMLFNIVVLDDDDGTGGTIDKAQAKTIRELMISAGADEAGFLKFMHASSVDEIAYRDYRKAVSALEGKIAKKEKANDAG
jgi:hypothetical protein